jgi:ribonuclease/clavin/mitogillin
MSTPTLYEQVLLNLGSGAALPKPKPPRTSASVVLWRRNPQRQIEVFWIQRAPELAFMGGWHAFPGGAISRSDLEVKVKGFPGGFEASPELAGLPVAVVDGIDELGPILAEGLLAGALRELFEETGLLVSEELELQGPENSGVAISRLDASRRRLLAGKTSFVDLLEEFDLDLDATSLVYAGRWLTPPLGPVRFDNRFFLLEWPENQILQPEVNVEEASHGEWVTPRVAIDSWTAGKTITAPPILHILKVLSQSGSPFDLPRLQNPIEANLGPFRRIEFRPGVLLFPLATPTLPPAQYTNTYLVGTEEVVLIDPGSPFDREIGWLVDALRETKEKLNRQVSAIWLTHHHPDHVGGVDRLRRELKVPVCAHRLTAEKLEATGIAVDRILHDGEIITLQGEPRLVIRVLHTPGHASGHLCFYDEVLGSLIAGDLVAGFGTIVVDPPDGNMNDYLSSLERMRALAPATLFPAHGPTIKNVVGKLDEYLAHRLWREERVFETWHVGLRKPSEMLSRIYEDLPAIAEPLALRQIEAHLERLRSRGRLD